MSSHLAEQILREVKAMTVAELQAAYGVEVIDGKVWDAVEGKEYPSLTAWAQYAAIVEDDDSYGGKHIKGGKNRGFDDD